MPTKEHRRPYDKSLNSSVSSRDSSPSVSVTEPIIITPASQDMTDETPYYQSSPIVQATGDIEPLTCPRPTTLYFRASPIVQATGDLSLIHI